MLADGQAQLLIGMRKCKPEAACVVGQLLLVNQRQRLPLLGMQEWALEAALQAGRQAAWQAAAAAGWVQAPQA